MAPHGSVSRVSSAACSVCAFVVANGYEFTFDNWNQKTSGKQVLVLFSSSEGCHRGAADENVCARLEDIWADLRDEWEGVDHAAIGTVDCDGKGRIICQRMGIAAAPNMRFGWGGPDALRQGGLTGWAGTAPTAEGGVEVLRNWAKNSLLPGNKPGTPLGTHVSMHSKREKYSPDGRSAQWTASPEELERLKQKATASFTPEEMQEAVAELTRKTKEESKTRSAELAAEAASKKRRKGKGKSTEL